MLANALALKKLTLLNSKASILEFSTLAPIPSSLITDLRKIHFLVSLSTRTISSLGDSSLAIIAITTPGNPPPDPKSNHRPALG